MARLVSVPVSMAIEAVLDGRIDPGVSAAPSSPDLIGAWLDELKDPRRDLCPVRSYGVNVVDLIWRWPTDHVHHVSGTAGPLTFVGGAGDFDSAGAIRNPGDLDAQVEGALANVSDALEAESCTFDDVVRLHIYYTDERDDWHVIARVASFLPQQPLPVISTVPEPLQPFSGQVVQIQAIAKRGWRSGSDIRVATRRAPGKPRAGLGGRDVTCGLRAGEFITIAHRTARDDTGTVIAPDDGVAQSHALIEMHEETLAELGAGMQDCVKMEGAFLRHHARGLGAAGTCPRRPFRRTRRTGDRGAVPAAEPGRCAVTKIGLMAMREKAQLLRQVHSA